MTDSLLWKINRDNFPPSFLFGTIHIYDSTVFRIPEMIYRLIDSVDIYLPESDTRRVPYGEIRNRMIVTDPDYSLKNFFDDKSYAEILSLSETETDILDKYKPFFVASLMMTDEDMPDDSVDFELLNYASSVGKTVCELESFEEQMNAIDNIPYREQAEIIERSMLSANKKGDFNKLMNSYKEQNLQAMKENLREVNPTEMFIDSIQKSRNADMSNKMDLLLRGGYSLFAAVGALHIPDTENVKGMVSILSDKGYDMEAINFSFVY